MNMAIAKSILENVIKSGKFDLARATELIPFTGDEFKMTTWIVLMVVSLAAVLVLVFLMLRKKK